MKALKRILIILFIIMLPYLEIISRKIPILDAILPIIIIVILIIGIVKLIKSIKSKVKKFRELKKEKNDILNQENEESVNLNQRLYEENKIQFDKERRRILISGVILTLFFSIIALEVSNYFYAEKLYKEIVPWIIFVSVIIAIIAAWVIPFLKIIHKYKLLKSNVINTFLKYENLKLKYYPDFEIFCKETNYDGDKKKEVYNEYLNVNFDDKKIDVFEVSEYINGFYNNTPIQFMDIGAGEYKKDGKSTYTKWYFKGNFTIIDRNVTDRNLKIINQKIDSFNNDNKNVEIDFDKNFKVISENRFR